MGAGERISRRAVVKAGETAAEMMEVQKTFMAETSKIVEHLKDAYDRNKEQIEDVEGDLERLDGKVSDIADDMDRIDDREEVEEYINNELEKRDAEILSLDTRITVFTEMGFADRLKWLLFGRV